MLEHGFNLDAVYLAGYAVECALKALILRWTPRASFEDMLERLTEVGAKGHDFEYLKGILKQQRGAASKTDRAVLPVLVPYLPIVSTWSSDLRYRVGTIKAKEAQRFVAAARAIYELCSRS